MNIPDPIYDDFYFSSPKNQEIILGVFETFKADLLLKCKEAVPEEYDETQMEMAVDWLYRERKGHNSCRSTTLQNLDNLEK